MINLYESIGNNRKRMYPRFYFFNFREDGDYIFSAVPSFVCIWKDPYDRLSIQFKEDEMSMDFEQRMDTEWMGGIIQQASFVCILSSIYLARIIHDYPL